MSTFSMEDRMLGVSRNTPIVNLCPCLNIQINVLTATPGDFPATSNDDHADATTSSSTYSTITTSSPMSTFGSTATSTPFSRPPLSTASSPDNPEIAWWTRSADSPFRQLSVFSSSLHSLSIQNEALVAVKIVSVPTINANYPPTTLYHSPSSFPLTHSPSAQLFGRNPSTKDWIVFHCSLCHLNCFALEEDSQRCVVNASLVATTDINALRSSRRYSPVFQIIMPQEDSRMSSSFIQSHHHPLVDSLRSSLEQSLESERVAMRMRISAFTAQQMEEFEAFEKQSKQELNLLANAINTPTQSASMSPSPSTVSSPSLRQSLSPSVLSSSPASPQSPTFEPVTFFLRRSSRSHAHLQRLIVSAIRRTNLPLSSSRLSGASMSDDLTESMSEDLGLGTISPQLHAERSLFARPVIRRTSLPGPSTSATNKIYSHSEITSIDEMKRQLPAPHSSFEASAVNPLPYEESLYTTKLHHHVHNARDSAKPDGGIFQLDEDTSDSDDNSDREILQIPRFPTTEPSSSDSSYFGSKIVSQTPISAVDDAVASAVNQQLSEEDEGDLSDEDMVARTSTADIREMVRRSSLTIPQMLPPNTRNPLSVSMVSNSSHAIPMPPKNQAGGSQLNSSSSLIHPRIPSSLPIPIPAPLQSPSQYDHDGLNSLLQSHDLGHSYRAAVPTHHGTFSEGHSEDDGDNDDADRLENERIDSIINADQPNSPIIPPHTLTQEPLFSFAKYRHLPDPPRAQPIGMRVTHSPVAPIPQELSNLSSSLPVVKGSLGALARMYTQSSRQQTFSRAQAFGESPSKLKQ